MSLEHELLSLFLPAGILNDFKIVSYKAGSNNNVIYDKRLVLELEELSIIPEEYKDYKYKNSGFMEARDIDDFPIRDMLVTLRVKRRRWDVNIDGVIKKVSRNWALISQGSSVSADYAAFLKEISR